MPPHGSARVPTLRSPDTARRGVADYRVVPRDGRQREEVPNPDSCAVPRGSDHVLRLPRACLVHLNAVKPPGGLPLTRRGERIETFACSYQERGLAARRLKNLVAGRSYCPFDDEPAERWRGEEGAPCLTLAAGVCGHARRGSHLGSLPHDGNNVPGGARTDTEEMPRSKGATESVAPIHANRRFDRLSAPKQPLCCPSATSSEGARSISRTADRRI
jgi:hypothetical protein